MSSSIIGRTLGKYKVIELLGQGGMATVYKGYQEEIDRYVAIKVLPPHPGLDEQFVSRFQLEARTIARMQHPHILPLYDFGTEDNILYLAMAYMEGGTLADIIDSGPMKISRIEKILREIASALDYAHRQGTIHRDIKPANILLDSEGHALLADFGIVKIAESGSNLTGTGLVGTPAYMAPEQAQGNAVDARADIYSLGVVVYEMLTGKQPFFADTPMLVLLKHMQEPVPSVMELVNVPPAVDYVLRRVLAKDPEDRYQTAVAFAEDFSHALHEHSESLVAARLERPLQSDNANADTGTMLFGGPQLTQVPQAGKAQQQPTVILQQSPASNPLILLGGFAIIAVVIVAVVLAVLGNQPTQTTENNTPIATTAVTQAAAIPTAIPIATFGQLRFTTSTNPGDTVQIQAEGLTSLPSGQSYAAWLLNTTSKSTLALGTLTLDAFGTGSLTFVSPENNVLPGWFDAIIITAEDSQATTPSEDVRYNGRVPMALTSALREILVTSSEQSIDSSLTPTPDTSDTAYEDFTPDDSSLLSGALAEAATAEQHSGLAANAPNLGGLKTHAEHTINILLGTAEDYNGNGRGENPGRKIGVPFYLDRIENLLNTATQNAPINIQNEAELIRVCIDNTRLWVDQVVELEKQFLAAEDLDSVDQQKIESTELTHAIVSGIDLNGNGVVEPFEGECGLEQIRTFGVLAASMNLFEGGLDQPEA